MSDLVVKPLNVGTLRVDKGFYQTLGRDLGVVIDMPSVAWYIEGAKERILVDTGMPDTEWTNKWHHPGSRSKEQEIGNALSRIGVKPEDVDIVVYTHLHWDHSHNCHLFKNATFMVQRDELRFALTPLPPYYRSYEALVLGIKPPFLDIPFQLVKGEKNISKGVWMFPTPGHSPGHQSVAVETSRGTYVITGDAVFCYENWYGDPEEHLPFIMIGRYMNLEQTWESFEKIKEIASYILPGHDAKVLGKDEYP